MKKLLLYSSRRKMIAILVLCLLVIWSASFAKNTAETEAAAHLKFNSDGTFKIVQFADIQDGPHTDRRTISLMEKILNLEKPNLVVLTGDNLDGKCKSVEDVEKAIDNIAQPMEKRKIPWAVVFGNHDAEHGMLSKQEIMNLFMSYPYNVSKPGPDTIDGIGNYNILVKGSNGNNPVFNIYFLDSGEYAPAGIGGSGWIKQSQILWYMHTALELKKEYSCTIPALMFFHIPLPEWKKVWDSGKAAGAKNEEIGSPKVNSGLFSAVVEMGDVKGIFVGHNHTNDFVGELYNVKLGYSRSIGYGTYGKGGFSRGARVFLINEYNPGKFLTWSRLDVECDTPRK